jgi:hypothetical protein
MAVRGMIIDHSLFAFRLLEVKTGLFFQIMGRNSRFGFSMVWFWFVPPQNRERGGGSSSILVGIGRIFAKNKVCSRGVIAHNKRQGGSHVEFGPSRAGKAKLLGSDVRNIKDRLMFVIFWSHVRVSSVIEVKIFERSDLGFQSRTFNQLPFKKMTPFSLPLWLVAVTSRIDDWSVRL